MNIQGYLQYTAFCHALEQDPEFQELEGKRMALEPDFRALMTNLSGAEREVITEYMGLCAEQQERTLEILYSLWEHNACAQKIPQQQGS